MVDQDIKNFDSDDENKIGLKLAYAKSTEIEQINR